MNVLQMLICVIAGMALMGLIVWFTMPLLMLDRHKSKLSYDETVTALSEALMKKQDWDVLNVNDFKKRTKDFVTLERVGKVIRQGGETFSVDQCHLRMLLTGIQKILLPIFSFQSGMSASTNCASSTNDSCQPR